MTNESTLTKSESKKAVDKAYGNGPPFIEPHATFISFIPPVCFVAKNVYNVSICLSRLPFALFLEKKLLYLGTINGLNCDFPRLSRLHAENNEADFMLSYSSIVNQNMLVPRIFS